MVSNPQSSPKRIIIVEDDFNIANLYKNKLTEEGYEVKITSDKGAVGLISREKPNLVLLDIFMPNVSGLSILRELRNNIQLAGVSILVLTNDARPQDMETAIKLGADGYILKAETDLGSLANRVKAILDNKRSTDTDGKEVISGG